MRDGTDKFLRDMMFGEDLNVKTKQNKTGRVSPYNDS